MELASYQPTGMASLSQQAAAAPLLQKAACQQAVASGTNVSANDDNIQPAASADDPQGLKMAAAAAKAGGLRTPEEPEIFHDAITGRNITKFQDLVDIAKQIRMTGGY